MNVGDIWNRKIINLKHFLSYPLNVFALMRYNLIKRAVEKNDHHYY